MKTTSIAALVSLCLVSGCQGPDGSGGVDATGTTTSAITQGFLCLNGPCTLFQGPTQDLFLGQLDTEHIGKKWTLGTLNKGGNELIWDISSLPLDSDGLTSFFYIPHRNIAAALIQRCFHRDPIFFNCDGRQCILVPEINECSDLENVVVVNHGICAEGSPLPAETNPNHVCVAPVCAHDPYCCNTRWDSRCIQEVGTYCGFSCAPVQVVPR